jgi:hypothetical protein
MALMVGYLPIGEKCSGEHYLRHIFGASGYGNFAFSKPVSFSWSPWLNQKGNHYQQVLGLQLKP